MDGELTIDNRGWVNGVGITPVSFVLEDGEPAGIVFLNSDGTTTDATEEVTPSVLWDEAAQEAVRNTGVGPTIGSRAYGMVHTAMFDAWAAYDSEAIATQLGDDLQRPASENTLENKTEAMSYAAYRTLADLFPTQIDLFDSLMAQLGFDPEDISTDPNTPVGIGNLSAAALLEFRHADGSNQLGDLNDGAPYSDYTGYEPANPPQGQGIADPNRWQPLLQPLRDPDGTVQEFLTPQWGQVIPFGLESGDRFRPPEPPEFGSEEFRRLHEEVIEVSANLNDERKVIAEFWEDGPGTSFPPGTWMGFGQFVSERDNNSLDEDAQMFFMLGNAVMDAGIAAWESKVFYDYVRPITAIEALFSGQTIEAWGGPGQGTVELDGSEFIPYQRFESPTPPFAEYVSGHSSFSNAAAEVLRRFTGSDEFGASATAPAGESFFEPGFTPAEPVTLSWETFSEAASESGISRLYGGIHNQAGNLEGLVLGQAVGEAVWEQARFFIEGGEEEPKETLFVFGDSLSDTGNLFNATSALGFPNPPSPPYFDGRFSNGPVAVEILADKLDLNLSLDSNFAWSGARTGRDNDFDRPDLGFEIPGLLDQIDSFAESVGSEGADPEALYLVWVGGNDLLFAEDPEAVVTEAVTNIASAVTALADLGAETIAVAQTPDLGRTPFALASGLFEEITDASLAFNAGLEETLTSLEESLGIDAILVDLFSISERIAENPSDFGFSNITDPFLVDGVPVDATADPGEFFFWDPAHFTTEAHEIYADVFQEAIAPGPTPRNRVVGTSGADTLLGTVGEDGIFGLPGNDWLSSGASDDLLLGGRGNDILNGGTDNDTLDGGRGRDILIGGTDSDTFVLGTDTAVVNAANADLILAFQVGMDAIALTQGLTEDDLTLELVRGNTVIRITESERILGIAIEVTPDRLGGHFVSIDLPIS